MKLTKFLLLICLPVLISCQDYEEPEPAFTGQLGLRIENKSLLEFKEINVVFDSDVRHTYTKVGPHGKSQYIPFSYIYRYTYIEVKTGTKTYVIQPIDYFGETKYESGKYTYRLSISDPSSVYGLSLEFIED